MDAPALFLVHTLEDTPLPCWACDAMTGRILAANRAAGERLGWSREAMLERRMADLWFDASGAEHELRTAVSERRVASWRQRTADGSALVVHAAVSTFETGGPQAYLLFATRITELGRASLEADLGRLSALLDHTPDGVSLVAGDGSNEYVSPGAERVLGHSVEELTRVSAKELTHPDDVARVQPLYRELLAEPGGTRTFRSRVRHKSGHYRWIESSVTNLRHVPEVNAVVAFYRDVTEHVEAREELLRAERSFRALIEQLPIGVLVNRGGQIAYVNPALLEMLGHSTEAELVGRSPLLVVDPAHRESAAARIAHLEAAPIGTLNPPAEREFVRADGSSMSVEVEALRLLFDGEPALVVLVRDLRERREMLARMAAADRLAAMGTLAAGVAHEINNPLAFVLSNLAILSEELAEPASAGRRTRLGPADLQMFLRDAREGATRIRAVVNGLRLLSHPGSQAVEAGPVDVGEVVSSCLRMASREITARARLRVEIGETPRVCGDSSRVAQVVLNLLLNAAQAIPEGCPDDHEVRVSTFRAASSRVVIEVADTGCGIPSEALGRIFDPFFTTKPVGIGTGLGLSISRSVLQSMGGQITVDTEMGRGSTFRVVLPPLDSPAPTSAGIPAEGSVEARLRVLLIDDERALGDSLRILLSDFHDVESTTSAKEAVARLRSGVRYDAILCDMMMPELDGMAFYSRLREIAPDLVPRVAFLTGGAFTPASREFLERVPNPCLEKPFDLSSLLRLIDRVANAANASLSR